MKNRMRTVETNITYRISTFHFLTSINYPTKVQFFSAVGGGEAEKIAKILWRKGGKER